MADQPTPQTLPWLMSADVFHRVKNDEIAVCLHGKQPLLLIDKKGHQRYVPDTSVYTPDQWATATAKGLVFVLSHRRWFYSEHLSDAAIPVIPVPYDQVTTIIHPQPAAAEQVEMPLQP